MSTHALFWVIGTIIGCGIAGMLGKSFVEERGRGLIPLFVGLAVVFSLAIGWALNAWIDYRNVTAGGGGGM